LKPPLNPATGNCCGVAPGVNLAILGVATLGVAPATWAKVLYMLFGNPAAALCIVAASTPTEKTII